jgi:hypothetical protein
MHPIAQLITASPEQRGIHEPTGTSVRALKDPPCPARRHDLSLADLRHLPFPSEHGRASLMGNVLVRDQHGKARKDRPVLRVKYPSYNATRATHAVTCRQKGHLPVGKINRTRSIGNPRQ